MHVPAQWQLVVSRIGEDGYTAAAFQPRCEARLILGDPNNTNKHARSVSSTCHKQYMWCDDGTAMTAVLFTADGKKGLLRTFVTYTQERQWVAHEQENESLLRVHTLPTPPQDPCGGGCTMATVGEQDWRR